MGGGGSDKNLSRVRTGKTSTKEIDVKNRTTRTGDESSEITVDDKCGHIPKLCRDNFAKYQYNDASDGMVWYGTFIFSYTVQSNK